MALDKYYGSPEDFKAFVDACHARGMAVIVDIVYNHAFGQSPLARLWWNEASFRPTPDNPYLNITPRHPFNVGYDFNHESALTKEFVKVTTQYWLEEFRIDGFRWDLSKGFTQNFSGDVGTWNQYDASRIAILKDYADHVWSVDEEAYMIMEHLGVSEEEDELAQYGNSMYFWSGFNPHDQYLEGAMGFPSNFREVISENRGFSDLNLVGYMESHDEERMQFKNEEFGNRSPNFRYDVRNQGTGLDRIELASAFFYTVPGPKMLWQFGGTRL
jgi:pullulanase/glycogen debranching enzyme